MRYFLTENTVLKLIEVPSVYNLKTDELYELDDASFGFLQKCASAEGGESQDREFTDYCVSEGLLSLRQTHSLQPPLIQSPVPSLRYLELQITDRCNLRCRHCYIGEKAPEELSLCQITAVLREFAEMQGLRVMITGGEPLLHGKFTELNSVLPEFPLRKVLFTNGLLLDNTLLRGLHVDEIQISLDGLEMAHDSLRGPGTFSRALGTVRLAKDAGFEVSVATMVHAKNLEDFDVMEELFTELGVRDWTVDVPCNTGRLGQNNEFQVPPEVGGKYLRYGWGGGLHAGQTGFGCGLHLMSVMADGRAAKCTFYSDRPSGEIGDGLRACWSRTRPVALKDLDCDCEFLETCRGGCRYRAELTGGPLGRDLYKCFMHDIIKKQTE